MQIHWFNNLELITNSARFLISNDKTVLKIKNIDENTEGKYFCKAFIIGDESTKLVLPRNVHILKVGKYNSFIIVCLLILLYPILHTF